MATKVVKKTTKKTAVSKTKVQPTKKKSSVKVAARKPAKKTSGSVAKKKSVVTKKTAVKKAKVVKAKVKSPAKATQAKPKATAVKSKASAAKSKKSSAVSKVKPSKKPIAGKKVTVSKAPKVAAAPKQVAKKTVAEKKVKSTVVAKKKMAAQPIMKTAKIESTKPSEKAKKTMEVAEKPEVMKPTKADMSKTTKEMGLSAKKIAKPVSQTVSVSKPESVKTMIKTEKRDVTQAGMLDFAPYQEKSGENYMNENQKEHFRHILNLWKSQLMSEVDSTVVHMQEEPLSYPDPLDRASQEQDFNLELRTRDRERKLIKKIEKALDTLDSGEYGYCDDCGAEIGIRRLEARPTANKCIDCKTFEEIREKQEGL